MTDEDFETVNERRDRIALDVLKIMLANNSTPIPAVIAARAYQIAACMMDESKQWEGKWERNRSG